MFEASPKIVRQTMGRVVDESPAQARDIILNNLGRNNLSCFLIMITPDDLINYECEVDARAVPFYCNRISGRSLIMLEDIYAVNVKQLDGKTFGEFSFDVYQRGEVTGICLFEAKKVEDVLKLLN